MNLFTNANPFMHYVYSNYHHILFLGVFPKTNLFISIRILSVIH
jgi:hypothetical protein